MERREYTLQQQVTLREVMTPQRYFEDPYNCEIDRKILTDKYADTFDLHFGVGWRRIANSQRERCESYGLFAPHVKDTEQADHIYSVLALGFEERSKGTELEDVAEIAPTIGEYFQKSSIFRRGNGTCPDAKVENQVLQMLSLGAFIHDVIRSNPPIHSN